MKKSVTFLLVLISLLCHITSHAQVFSFSVQSVCFNSVAPTSNTTNAFVVSNAPGATSYSWAAVSGSNTGSVIVLSGPTSSSAVISFTACGIYTVSCIAFNNAIPLSTASNTIDVMCPNWLTTASPNVSVCPGSSALLSASGGTSYIWMASGGPFGVGVVISNAATAVATPTNMFPQTNDYTVTATNSMGCTAQDIVSIVLAPNAPSPFPLTANSNPLSICAGASATLSAGGSASYTWMPGNVTTTNVVVNPTSTTCYTLFGLTPSCLASTVTCISVAPLPTVTINTPPSGSITCAGSPYSMTAFGAWSYTWIPGNFQGASITPFMATSTCFTVIGASPSNCIGYASTCVSVTPLPNILATAITTVCQGTSAQLTAAGANTYTWSTGATTPSISVIPLTSTCYTVTGTGASNCTSTAVSCVIVNSGCSDVWPGDANSDGLVDNTDAFEIGLAFSNTGAARSPGGNAFTSQYALNWTSTISSGKNQCHADCNGDGTINNSDTLAIYNNYNLTHSFRSSGITASGDINIIGDQPTVLAGWNKANILLGDVASPMNQVYGVAYDLNFDQSLIVTDSAYVIYIPSFLNASNQNVIFRRTFFSNGKIATTSVRTNGANVNGNGKIGELWFKVKTGLPANTQLNLSVTGAKKISATGTLSNLTGGSAVLPVLSATITGLQEKTALKNTISVLPNPASTHIMLQSNAGTEISYSAFDVTGREVFNGSFIAAKTIDLSAYASGAYILRFESATGTVHKKFIIEK